MMRRALLLATLLGFTAWADAGSDWQQVVAMDTEAPAGPWKSRDEARSGTVDYLGKQERVLRDFLAGHPGDPHEMDAELRLAHLLATRADLEQAPQGHRDAEAIFHRLEADPKFRDRRADIDFARLSLFMQHLDTGSAESRASLLARARAFAAAFPRDHRVAALFAEVAGAFSDQPKVARSLLEAARPLADTDELRARIDDDLKRLALLGNPLPMRWTSIQGQPVNLEKMRGKVAAIYFFASWSPPSMAELDWVRQLAAQNGHLQILGVCLDSDPVAVPSMLADHQIGWPVYCDGAGWGGALVRGLGINALPALWIVDRDGILRSISARPGESAARLLRE